MKSNRQDPPVDNHLSHSVDKRLYGSASRATAADSSSVTTKTTRGPHQDDTTGAEAFQPHSLRKHQEPMLSPPKLVPGAFAVAGLDAPPEDDQGTGLYGAADDADLPVPAAVVDTDEENQLLNEQNLILRQQVDILKERERVRQQEEHSCVAEAQLIAGPGISQPTLMETLGNSKTCRWITLALITLAIVSVAVAVSVLLTQGSEAATVESPSTGTTTPTTSGTPSPPAGTSVPTDAGTTSPTTTGTPPTTTGAPLRPTGTPSQELIDYLSSVSQDGGKAMLTPDTPQNQALLWLAGNTNLASYTDDKKKQRYTLATLFFSTCGDTEWTHKDNWLDDGDECNRWWQGPNDETCTPFSTLQCTDEGAIMELDLVDNNLHGTIPAEIGLLSEALQCLDLSDNELAGQFPGEITQLTKLETLNISFNAIYGPIPSDNLDQLTDLELLVLGSNPLKGPIPSEVGQLVNLDKLLLFWNKLSGTVPSEISNLKELRWLWIENNELTGPFPTFFESMTSLRSLAVGGNEFTGTVECPDFVEWCYLD